MGGSTNNQEVGKNIIICLMDVIQMDIGGHPPFPTGSKQFSDNFGNLLCLVVLTSKAILRA